MSEYLQPFESPARPVAELPAEPAAPAGAKKPARRIRFDRERLARLVSLVFHPFLISPLSIVTLLSLDAGRLLPALGWASLCAAFVVAPALLYLRQKLKKKQLSDADVSVREHRHAFYLFGAACMAVCFAVLLWLGAPRLLIVLFVAALGSVAAFAAVTRFWTKVSIHTGVLTGVTVAVAFYAPLLALFLAAATLLVAWARLILKRHTPLQAALGAAIAAIAVLAVFLPGLRG